jgi:hypothetical protein
MESQTMSWTPQEEKTIAGIMAGRNLTRIEAIQAMQRRKKAGQSPSHRLKLQDAFDSSARCQNDFCAECALTSGEIDPEMAAFLDIVLNNKQRSGKYFLIQRDPLTGLFPVSARMDGDPESKAEAESGLVPKEPYESALELTKDGVIEGRVFVHHAESGTAEGNAVPPPTEAASDENVDGLMPISSRVAQVPTPSESPIKALRGRPKGTGAQKRLAAAERQARWRRKQAAELAKAA